VTATDTHRAIDAVWRIESARIIAGFSRGSCVDVGHAEELAQDALVAALEQWPKSGIPDNPGAWLMAAREASRNRSPAPETSGSSASTKNSAARSRPSREMAVPDLEAAIDDNVGDDLLRLVFISCHPVLTSEARVALTLRLLGGLTTDEIARAFLVPEATVAPAHRPCQAKRWPRLMSPFEVPRGDELAARLSSVLEVLYLIFNEGYTATAGDDWMRPALCEEALRLWAHSGGTHSQGAGKSTAWVCADGDPGVTPRRRPGPGPLGEPILLLDQDRGALGSTPHPSWSLGARSR